MITSILRNLAVLLGCLVGLHRVVIGAVIGSFQAVPAGTIQSTSNLTELVLALTGDAVGTGVKLAIPLIAVLLVTQVALAFVSRAAPAMQVFSIGFAVTLAVGALILIATLPDMAYDVAADTSVALGRGNISDGCLVSADQRWLISDQTVVDVQAGKAAVVTTSSGSNIKGVRLLGWRPTITVRVTPYR